MLRDLTDSEARAALPLKWGAVPEGTIPAWVAEMDFAPPPAVTAALTAAVGRGMLGYSAFPGTAQPADLDAAFRGFAERHWGWEVPLDSSTPVGDVVAGLRLALDELCPPGPVVVPLPCYPPFRDVVALAGREAAYVGLDPDHDHDDRAAWDAALNEAVAAHEPDLVVLAGFMKLVGPAFLGRFGGRTVNTHPALSPSFPGMSGPADALAYGVKVTGCTLFVVDEGVDTGQIVAQVAVPVEDDDDVASLHERIKTAERTMLVDAVGVMARDGFSVEGRRVRLGPLPGS